jgi:hypothetical protein
MTYDGAGTLFVTDQENYTIRRVEVSTGQVTTLAGMAGASGSTDGTGADVWRSPLTESSRSSASQGSRDFVSVRLHWPA